MNPLSRAGTRRVAPGKIRSPQNEPRADAATTASSGRRTSDLGRRHRDTFEGSSEAASGIEQRLPMDVIDRLALAERASEIVEDAS
jgi:hypothetical protein